MTDNTPLWTVGTIAKAADSGIHRVEYLLKARGFRPINRAGNARIFSAETAHAIVAELQATNERKKSPQ